MLGNVKRSRLSKGSQLLLFVLHLFMLPLEMLVILLLTMVKQGLR